MSAPAHQTQTFAANLRLLNDVLARTAVAGRYWVNGGLLLGWAREGAILSHDAADADFFYLREDTDRLAASFPALLNAGFGLLYRFPGITGEATEFSFWRDGAKFEFFRAEVISGASADDPPRLRWWNYGYADHGPCANMAEIPAQPLEEFRFLDRTWLKAADHDLELSAMFDDWRVPRPDWDYMRAPTIVSRHPWDDSSHNLLALVPRR